MQKPYIIYNGVKYHKHPKQKYYYCGRKRPYSRCLHRQIWYDVYGEIPEGYQVHHKNGDSTDNRIENLELIERSAHGKLHGKERFNNNPEFYAKFSEKGRELAKEWHSSNEGREWHRLNAKKNNFGYATYGKRKCEQCGNEYEAKTTQARFCSNNCKSKWRRENIPDIDYANCEKCGKLFVVMRYYPKRFCSPECKPTPNPKGWHSRK